MNCSGPSVMRNPSGRQSAAPAAPSPSQLPRQAGGSSTTPRPRKRSSRSERRCSGTALGCSTAAQPSAALPSAHRATPDLDLTGVPGLATSETDPRGPQTEIKGSLRHDEADSDDFDLIDANTFKPSAMAISLQCRVPAQGFLLIRVTGAYYERLSVHIPGLSKPVDWWRRRPFTLQGTVPGNVLRDEINRLKIVSTESPKVRHRASRLQRGYLADPCRVSTIRSSGSSRSLVVNNVKGSGPSSALFQMGFTVRAGADLVIEPYPEVELPDQDHEEQSISLLYRHRRTYAIGHGCAAEWDGGAGSPVPFVKAVAMPAYEVVSLTPKHLPDG